MWSPSSSVFGKYQIEGVDQTFSQLEQRKVFKGHRNPKFATSIACSRDLIACGGEENKVVIYSKNSTFPILDHSFNSGLATQDYNQYVTDICWDHSELNLIASNSKGIIKALQLSKLADDEENASME